MADTTHGCFTVQHWTYEGMRFISGVLTTPNLDTQINYKLARMNKDDECNKMVDTAHGCFTVQHWTYEGMRFISGVLTIPNLDTQIN